MLDERIEHFPVKTASGQADLAIRIWPAKEKKGRVICLHEAACSSVEYAFLAEALTETGFEVVAPDLIGHGMSTYFGDPESYQVYDFVNCAARVIRRYSEDSMQLLGASFGGLLLLVYMLAAKIAPRSAIFIDVPLYRTAAAGNLSRMMNLIRGDFDTLDEAKAHFDACRHPLPPDALHLEPYLTANRFHVVDGKTRLRCDRFVMDRYDRRWQRPEGFSYLEELPKLRCNCLFLYGADSRNHNQAIFDDLSSRHPNLSFATIEGGHPPPLTSFGQIRPIVDFVKEQASATVDS
jgi:pimeloyl-ACP methyl ester carboxylesterase